MSLSEQNLAKTNKNNKTSLTDTLLDPPRSMWLAFFAAFAAIIVALLLALQELPIEYSSDSIIKWAELSAERSISSGSYNIQELHAPALAGRPLTIFAYVATKSILRPVIIRHFLKQNGVHRIRELAATLKDFPPTYYPITRLTESQYNEHVRASEPSLRIMKEGLSPSSAVKIRSGRYRSVMDYHVVYESEKATPVQVMSKVLEGCEHVQHLRIFSSLIPTDVLQQAKESAERWESKSPLSIWDGVPVAFKDMVCVMGHLRCDGGSTCHACDADDPTVKRFRELGAIILGATVMTEGGVTPLGYNKWFDGPFNPYDTNYYSGGSSSGSAVVVAAGLAPVALGYDGGGSIRVPAAMSGTFGLAATAGRVETNAALGLTNVKGGPLAATLQDTALAHLVLSQVNASQFYSLLYDGGVRGLPPAHLKSVDEPVRGMRLGIYWEHFKHSDPEIVSACSAAIEFLERQGAVLVNITIPHLREIHLSHGIKILSEFAQFWDSAFYDPTIALEANTEITLAMGKEITAGEVLAAEKVRTFAGYWLREKIFCALELDAIVSPTLGTKVPMPKAGFRRTGESNTPLVYKIMRYIPLANFLGLPGLSVPIGYEQDTNLPIGFQVLGDAWNEHKLLRIGNALESDFLKRKAPPSRNFYDPLADWLSEETTRFSTSE
jgi:Asp-tRNA(Asn)/Glu-tRNA(Gln) amidotransferase A subunit family amidase